MKGYIMNTLNTLITSINENIKTNTVKDLMSIGLSQDEATSMLIKFTPNYQEQAELFASFGDEDLTEVTFNSEF
jgi:hypothetical protein